VKLARLHAAESLNDLASLPGTRLEKLVGDRAGQYSIRVNDQFRICFRWTNAGAADVEIIDYH
jgi:proteic killer suppression protein